MNKYIVDTTVLIEHLRGNEKAKNFLQQHAPGISTVTIAELIQGSRDKKELTPALKVCESLSEYALSKKISHTTVHLMQEFFLSHGLLFLDALIAATAIENKAVLVTENVKHFRFIKELQLLPQEEAFE